MHAMMTTPVARATITPIHRQGAARSSSLQKSNDLPRQAERKDLGKIVEEMRADYQVTFCERIIDANIGAIKVTVSGDGAPQEVVDAIQALWDKTTSTMKDDKAFGRVAYELEWGSEFGYQIPCKCEALPFRLSRMKLVSGHFAGIEIKPESSDWENIEPANAWWLALDATVVQPHGQSRFIPAPYEVYKDKKGAKKNRKTATSKWAVRGPIMRGPITDFDEQTQQTYEVLPEMAPAVDTWSEGGMLYMSNERDPASKEGQEYKYVVEQADLQGFDPNALNATMERMDVELSRAFGIAEQTIMEAGGVGTYGSIAQKMLLLFAVCEDILDQRCRSFEKYVIGKVCAVNGLPDGCVTLSYTSLAQRPDAFIFEAIKQLLANQSFVEGLLSGGVDIGQMLEDAGFPVTEQIAAAMQSVAQRLAATAAAGAPPVGDAPAGEMSGLGRRQWQNNKKAIFDVLDDVKANPPRVTDVMAKELLQSLGVPPDRAQIFIDDAKDGKVDDPELNDPTSLADLLGGSDVYSLAWTSSHHPRDKNGKFVSKMHLEAAAKNPNRAIEVRKLIGPKDLPDYDADMAKIHGSAYTKNVPKSDPTSAPVAPTSKSNPSPSRSEPHRNPPSSGGDAHKLDKLKPSRVKDAAAQQYVEEWTGEGGGQAEYEAAKQAGKAWANGGKNPAIDAVYNDTQSKLKAAGVTSVTAYRGVQLPDDHPLMQDIRSGKIKVGDDVDISGTNFVGWSTDGGVAGNYAKTAAASTKGKGPKMGGIVLERVIPAEDIVTGSSFHEGFIGAEKELVAKHSGGPYKIRLREIH